MSEHLEEDEAQDGSDVRGLVHVVDDDSAVRESLMFMVRLAGYDVNGYSSPEEVLSKAPHAFASAGCIVMDYRFEGSATDGVSLLGELGKRGVSLPAVVISGNATVPIAVRAIKCGAVDFLEKPFTRDTMLDAIAKAMARGASEAEAPLPAADAALAELAHAKIERLRPREREVLSGLVAGWSNKEIARELRLSHRTVEIFRGRMMKTLGAETLAEALRMALAAGVQGATRKQPAEA